MEQKSKRTLEDDSLKRDARTGFLERKPEGGVLKEESWKRNLGGGSLEVESWGGNPVRGILKKDSSRRNLRGGILEESPDRRNLYGHWVAPPEEHQRAAPCISIDPAGTLSGPRGEMC